MYILDNVTVADQFPGDFAAQALGPLAIMGPAIKSNGGYFQIANNPVYAQLAYSPQPAGYGFGQVTWTKAFPFPVGPGILAPGTVGIRFKNYTPGSAAVVSGALSEHSEPQIEVTSSGSTSGAGSTAQIVTGFPGSPTNGQQIIFTDSVSAPTYSWLLQYDSLALVWRFIGGSKLEGTTTITIPRDGSYYVEIGAESEGYGAAQNVILGLTAGGITLTAMAGGAGGGTEGIDASCYDAGRMTGLTTSQVLTPTSTGSVAPLRQYIRAQPVNLGAT